jgi:hypothetical protein
VVLLSQLYIFSPCRFFKFIIDRKSHFLYFWIIVLKRLERKSLDSNWRELKREKSLLAPILSMKNKKFGVDEFHLTMKVWLWLFWASILPEKNRFRSEKKIISWFDLVFHVVFSVFFYIDGFFDMLYRHLVSVFKLNWVFRGKTL